jgi:hypothetical protein
MTSQKTDYQNTLSLLRFYFVGLFGCVIVLCALHWFFADLKSGGVYWFNLDKERNLATWFSGLLLCLFGCMAIWAYYWERRRNHEGEVCFRLPVLWLGVGLAGVYFSLDEVTILHENLLWRETRQISTQFGEAWKYVTQWQILFAPAILMIFAYFSLFFFNRFQASVKAWYSAFAGLGCWIGSLLTEGLRGIFKLAGSSWYSVEVLVEEALEMTGTLFLAGSITLYVLDIAVGFTQEQRVQFQRGSRFLTKRVMVVLSIIFVLLLLSGAAIYVAARWQAETGAPVPQLIKKALSP